MGKPGQKVARVIDDYELEGLDETLVDLWTRDDSSRKSIRELADLVNAEIVSAVVGSELQGMTPMEYPPDRIATRLAARSSTDSRFEDVSQGDINEVTNWMESEGIDVDSLTNDFVTFGVVYDYLKNYHDAKASEKYRKSSSPEELKEKVTSRLDGLKEQVETVTKESNRSLENAGILQETNRTVTVDIRITCVNCGREYPAIEFVEANGCRACDDELTGPVTE
ncbi:hypothetical protein EA462_14295 [Natrarchaeobius halalkaliphilus]|uniref:Uncharacterized protein n=1 Tax=Natrarchaeobius halalkaliphilus TaxID=1679091 RepID=A0A3N6NVU8_9EURY|nr:rod-determining factor RdfA [Natrarchaeobius halalkaliphilus]RQG88022.1 hypothetical protein EA462_14295 [Natrarchaeobius halalkaliphilus]